MTNSKFEKIDDLDGGDDIKIHFSGQGSTEVNGVSLPNPFKTTVTHVKERKLDHSKGDDVDGIVTRKEIFLEVPKHDDKHGEYVIITDRPMVGQNRVHPIEVREYFEGKPGDGKYTINSLSFDDIS